MGENPIQKWLYHKHHILENIRNFTFHAPSWNMVCIAVLLYNYWIQIFRNQQKKFQYYFEMQLHNFCYLLSVLTNLFKNHQNFHILLCSRFSGEIVSLSPLITLPPLPPIRPCFEYQHQILLSQFLECFCPQPPLTQLDTREFMSEWVIQYLIKWPIADAIKD